MAVTSDALQQLIAAIQNPTTQTNSMTAAPSAQSQLASFFNTPGYQAAFGNTSANLAQAGNYSPTAAFQADPGYQFNQEQTARQMQMESAAKGLLSSGGAQAALQTQLQGNQNQEYQTWLSQQTAEFNNYQSQLQGLMNTGNTASNAQATAGTTNANTLSALLSGNTMTGATGTSNANLSTGDNISSLLANLGSSNASLISGTGSAEANALMQAFGINAQQQNAAQVSSAQQQSSQLSGLGSLLGGQMAYGAATSPYTGSTGSSSGGLF